MDFQLSPAPITPPVRFSGADYDPERDRERLMRQIDCIREVALNAGWVTVQKLAIACRKKFPNTGFPENSIQAQLRNLRKVGFRLERRHVSGGLFEYHLSPPVNPGADLAMRAEVASA